MQNGTKPRRIGLAVGGGAARGVAHVGVLEILEREGIRPDVIAGTSVGALIGALICAGFSAAELSFVTEHIGWSKLLRLQVPGRGLFTFERMGELMIELLGDITFADLKIPFALVATDVNTGEMVTITEGPLTPAVMASCAVPGLIEPVQVGDRLLCDGGIINNTPISTAREMGADYVIGIDIFEPHYDRHNPLGMALTAIEVLINRAGMGLDKADCLIKPDLAGISFISFMRKERLLQKGREAAITALPGLRQALGQRDGVYQPEEIRLPAFYHKK